MVEVVRVHPMGASLQAYVSYFRHVREARRAFLSSLDRVPTPTRAGSHRVKFQ